MAHALVAHESHALLDGLFGQHEYDAPFHDLPDRRRGRQMALEYNVTRIVSLGDDTDQFLAIHHEQRSDVILSHFCDRVEDRGVRVNGRNGPILLVEQLQYGYHLGSSQLHPRYRRLRGTLYEAGKSRVKVIEIVNRTMPMLAKP